MVQTWIKFFKNLKLTFGAVKNLIQGSLAPLSQQITTNHSLSTIRWKCAKEYCVSSPISWVIFSVFDKTMGVFFYKKWDLAYSRGFGIQKQVQLDQNCHDNNEFLTTNKILCFPCIERQSHSTWQNSSHFTLQMKCLVSLLRKPLHHFLL